MRAARGVVDLPLSISVGQLPAGALKPVDEVHRLVRIRAHVGGTHVEQVNGTGGGVGCTAPERGRAFAQEQGAGRQTPEQVERRNRPATTRADDRNREMGACHRESRSAWTGYIVPCPSFVQKDDVQIRQELGVSHTCTAYRTKVHRTGSADPEKTIFSLYCPLPPFI
jgi:hypothetical protein